MPQLNDSTAQKVADAEDGFALLDPGVYLVQLVEVEVKKGDKGPYWAWRFDIPEGLAHSGRRFYENTSMSEAAFFRLKGVFAAFEVPTTTNTDDLLGRQIRLVVGHETINKGPNMGKLRNCIDKLLPKDGPTGTDEETFKEVGVTPSRDVSLEKGDESFEGGSKEDPLF